MKHIIAYAGKVLVALGVMQEDYVRIFQPWANKRIGIEGTMLQPPYTLSSGLEWIRNLDKSRGQTQVFAVLLRDDKKRIYRYVGHMGIHDITWPHGFASTGSVIGADGARGRGVGTEAKLLLLYHAFMILGLRKLTSTVKAFNAQSVGHLMKCGYKLIGRYREHHLHEGEFVDKLIFEVFREDWEPIWDEYQRTAQLPSLSSAQRALINREMR